MTVTLGGVFVGAGALWRTERDLLVRIAGVFFFLPQLAAQLFIVPPVTEGLSDAALWDAITDWYAGNALWFALVLVAQTIGAGTILTMLLDPDRPIAGHALLRTIRLLPSLMLGLLGTLLLVLSGSFLLVIPGLYLAGRCALVLPVLVAEPERGPFLGFAAALERTRGHGWMLLLAIVAVWAPGVLVAGIVNAVAEPAGAAGQAIAALLVAAISAMVTLVLQLVQVTAYRGLTEPRQGI